MYYPRFEVDPDLVDAQPRIVRMRSRSGRDRSDRDEGIQAETVGNDRMGLSYGLRRDTTKHDHTRLSRDASEAALRAPGGENFRLISDNFGMSILTRGMARALIVIGRDPEDRNKRCRKLNTAVTRHSRTGTAAGVVDVQLDKWTIMDGSKNGEHILAVSLGDTEGRATVLAERGSLLTRVRPTGDDPVPRYFDAKHIPRIPILITGDTSYENVVQARNMLNDEGVLHGVFVELQAMRITEHQVDLGN